MTILPRTIHCQKHSLRLKEGSQVLLCQHCSVIASSLKKENIYGFKEAKQDRMAPGPPSASSSNGKDWWVSCDVPKKEDCGVIGMAEQPHLCQVEEDPNCGTGEKVCWMPTLLVKVLITQCSLYWGFLSPSFFLKTHLREIMFQRSELAFCLLPSSDCAVFSLVKKLVWFLSKALTSHECSVPFRPLSFFYSEEKYFATVSITCWIIETLMAHFISRQSRALSESSSIGKKMQNIHLLILSVMCRMSEISMYYEAFQGIEGSIISLCPRVLCGITKLFCKFSGLHTM